MCWLFSCSSSEEQGEVDEVDKEASLLPVHEPDDNSGLMNQSGSGSPRMKENTNALRLGEMALIQPPASLATNLALWKSVVFCRIMFFDSNFQIKHAFTIFYADA